jgi:hypothetical protein
MEQRAWSARIWGTLVLLLPYQRFNVPGLKSPEVRNAPEARAAAQTGIEPIAY